MEQKLLSKEEVARYSRNILLSEVGRSGQERLKHSSALVVGMGGLGSPSAMYLAAAGVGRLGIADFDMVQDSNLQRQILHFTNDVGRLKVGSAREKLQALNPFVEIKTHKERISAENVREIIADYDVILDCSDNFSTRYLLNDACFFAKKTLISAAIHRFSGQVSVFCADSAPCYRCLFPVPPPADLAPDCSNTGVLGILAGIIGSIQANEALKFLLNIGELLSNRLLLFDALSMNFSTVSTKKNPQCPLCGNAPTITSLQEAEILCETEKQPEQTEISPDEFHEKIGIKPPFDFILLDVREQEEFDFEHYPNSVCIPLGALPERFEELDVNKEIIVVCEVGLRSATGAYFLRKNGFSKAKNLAGGLLNYEIMLGA